MRTKQIAMSILAVYGIELGTTTLFLLVFLRIMQITYFLARKSVQARPGHFHQLYRRKKINVRIRCMTFLQIETSGVDKV